MTCIVTLVTPHYTLQASDRLLTRGASRFDARANKALIIGTQRGIVSLAFSGAAFVNGRTTDQRIAEQVTQTALDQDATQFGSASVAPSIGHVLRALVEYFYDSDDWRQFQSEFVATGWQWELRGSALRNYRPILYGVKSVRRTGPLTRWQEIPRHWPDWRGVWLRISGMDPFTEDERQSLPRRITGGIGRLPPPEDAEAVLVGIVREAAQRNADIGQDCMSILLPQSEPWKPRVNFIPLSEHKVTWVQSGQRVPIGYTPWVVHGGAASGPKMVLGVTGMGVGGLSLRVESPPPIRIREGNVNHYITGAMQGMHRPLPSGSPPRVGGPPPEERIFSE